MSQYVIFNGQRIVVPGGASFIDATALLSLGLGTTGAVALIGEADGGEPGVHVISNPNLAKSVFRSGDLANAIRLAFKPASDALVPGGASVVYAVKVNASTQAALALSSIDLQSIDYGLHTNQVYGIVGDGVSGGKIITIGFEQEAKVSSELGLTDIIDILYTGDASTAIITNSATVITTTLAGDQSDGSANLSIDLATYNTIQKMADYINAQTGYRAAIKTSEFAFDPANFDRYTGKKLIHAVDGIAFAAGSNTITFEALPDDLDKIVDGTDTIVISNSTNIGNDGEFVIQSHSTAGNGTVVVTNASGVTEAASPSTAGLKRVQRAVVKEIVDWVNDLSVYATATRKSGASGDVAPTNIDKTFFAGAIKGLSTNTTFQDGFNLINNYRINQVVPLISSDNIGGGSAEAETVMYQLKDHCVYASGIQGQLNTGGERQGYVGIEATKDQYKDHCRTLNNELVACTSMAVTALDVDGNQLEYPEWGLATICAGVQAGSEVGMPLTAKVLNVIGITQDNSWNPYDDADEMLLSGCLVARKNIQSGQIEIVKGITTYTAEDNDAFTQIEVRESLLVTSYELRNYLVSKFNGTKKKVGTASDYKNACIEKLNELSEDEVIISYDPKKINITVVADKVYPEVEVEPAQGIQYTLITVFAVQNVQTA